MGDADAAERVEAVDESHVSARIERDAATFAARVADAYVVGEEAAREEDVDHTRTVGATRSETEVETAADLDRPPADGRVLDATHSADERERTHDRHLELAAVAIDERTEHVRFDGRVPNGARVVAA